VKVESGRRIVPTTLGVTLIQGYKQIDADLFKPTVRAHIEAQISLVAEGRVAKDGLVRHALREFAQKFAYFVRKMDKMDALFEACFSPLADSGKPFCKCGKTGRFLKLISSRPPRLYNPHTEEVLSLPHGGAVKLYRGRVCPICNFEALLYTVGERTYPLCAACFNDGAALVHDGNPKGPVNFCPLAEFHPLVAELAVCPCPESDGMLILDPTGGPNWRLVSTRTNVVVTLPRGAHKISLLDQYDHETGCRLMDVDFHKSQSPLEGGATRYVGCILNDELLESLIETKYTSTKAPGRGRGRGRGKGRGGRSKGDPRLSFRDF
jgi:DNA topoisomerase-3